MIEPFRRCVNTLEQEVLAAYLERLESPERAAWQKPDEVVAALGPRPGRVAADACDAILPGEHYPWHRRGIERAGHGPARTGHADRPFQAMPITCSGQGDHPGRDAAG